VLAEHGADAEVARVDLVGELEVGGGDAVVRRPELALEDLVALGVLDLEGEVGLGDGLEVERPQGQGAEADELAGLVERLVGGQMGPLRADTTRTSRSIFSSPRADLVTTSSL
jgi:hypothetical protein